MKLIKIVRANDGKHKYSATFEMDSGRTKTTHFGATGYKDYTVYYRSDPKIANEKKENYLARHSVNEDFNDPTTAGALSRWILWNKPTIRASILNFVRHFHL